MTFVRHIRNRWFWFLSVAFGLGAAAAIAHAATYNFYFNNTEQGDNSTAAPNVNVSTDGKAGPATVTKTGANGLESKTEEPAPLKSLAAPVAAPEPAAPNASEAKARDMLAFDFSPDVPKWRITLAALMIPQTGPSDSIAPLCDEPWNCGYGEQDGFATNNQAGGAIGVSYFPLPWLGFNLYGGLYRRYDDTSQGLILGEIEALPLRLSLFGVEDAFELGVVAGANNIGDRREGSWTATHFGGRVNVNLSRHFGVTAAARFSPYFMGGEAGLTFRL